MSFDIYVGHYIFRLAETAIDAQAKQTDELN